MSDTKLEIITGNVREVAAVSDPMISMIERVVLDPNVSIDKLERMLAMKERLEDRALEERQREQTVAYYTAFADCQSEMRAVAKNQENKQTNSRYADLAALAEAVDPVIRKHGFSTSFQPAGVNEKGEQLIKWRIAHRQGHVESDVAALPADKTGIKGTTNKTDLHAFGSTATYGRRYLKLMLFDIATKDDDGNAGGSALVTEEQVAELIALADETEADKAKVCEWLKVPSFQDIPVTKFAKAKQALQDRKRDRNAGD